MAALVIAMTTVSCQLRRPCVLEVRNTATSSWNRPHGPLATSDLAKAFIKLHSKCSTCHRHDEIVIMSTGCN